MKYRALLITSLLFCVAAFADHHAAKPKATLMSGLGDIHHPVTTSNPEAQKFFDQGLRLIYAFNHDEAERSFRRAAELDPQMAMAWWGVALAVGPNYNLPVDAERERIAYDASQKALALSKNASESERAYIEALAKRYTNASNPDYKQLSVAYKEAMGQVAQRFPDDLDAATLYAESIMNLNPWALWKLDGTPWEGTPEILRVLESVMRRDPNHMGAVHYYLHSVEASRSPERALAGANKLASLAPAAGHLVHMPAHIYIRTGDYESARKTNVDAARVDEAYLKTTGETGGIYSLMYYSHNLHFISAAACLEGRYAEAKDAAQRLAAHVRPHVKDMTGLEGFLTVPLTVELRFERWTEVLSTPKPDPSLKTLTALWHYGHGLALASAGKAKEAEAEHKTLLAVEQATPPDEIFTMPFNNKTKDILKIAVNVLGARIATAKNDNATAIRLLEEAVAVQGNLNYGEPEDWYYPVRETLGQVLLASGDAKRAEQVFRADLEQHPRNGRSLFGLMETLQAQGRKHDATFVRQQFEGAWKNADTELRPLNGKVAMK
jgi:tetratricopeptide (TPR) repeat protein